MNYPIYIPTRGRAGDISTLNVLPTSMLYRVILVVRKDEAAAYEEAHPDTARLVLPSHIEGIHMTRQWILDRCWQNGLSVCIMYDDDITSFGHKPDTDSWKIVPASKTRIASMDRQFIRWVENGAVAMCGSSDRLAAGRGRKEYQDNTRIAQVMYLNATLASERSWRYDRVVVMGDMDMCMQIVADGMTVRKSLKYTHNLKPEGYRGGCALYRKDKHRRDAYRILRSHFGDCIVVNGLRHRIRWKKLAELSKTSDRLSQ